MKNKLLFFFQILYKPLVIFILSMIFIFINVILDGSFFHILNLNQDLRIVQNRIDHIKKKNKEIIIKAKQVFDPDFVKQETRNRLDYAGEGELIFLFPEDI